MDKRRELARIPVKRVMKPLRAGFATKTLRGHGQVVNLSKAGMFIASDELPRPGESIKVLFEDATGAKLEVAGNVRWTTEDDDVDISGFGMKIEKPSRDYLDFCDELLDAMGL